MSNGVFDSAISHRRRGFSVIPIKPRDKKPLIPWEPYQKEPASEETIKDWFATWPNANVGIVTGAVSDVVVIDLDSAEAKDKIKALLSNYDLSAVPRVRTGRGGYHLFFKHPGGSIQTRAGVLPKTDVRADGGYVVTAPSTHETGKQYAWEVTISGELPKLPPELHKLITAPSNGNGYRERFNTANALKGVPEGQRDQTLFKLASKLRNADVPQEMAETLILEAARNCQPPFPERTAIEKVSRAYQRYEPRQGAQKEQSEIWPEFLTAKDILQAPKDPTRWILDGCLPTAGGSLVVAKPKVGKSTTVADLCISVARGDPFLGRATQQGPIAYLFLDGPLPEIADVFVSLGLRESDPIYLHAGSAPASSIDWLLFTVKQKNVKLVVIDTLQKLLRFKDINDYSEVTNRMEPLLDAARQGNCHVMMLHHAGKYAADDLDAVVGSTALRGLCYTYLFLKRLNPKSDRRIISSDQRGGRNFPESAIGFNRLTKRIELQGTMEQVEIEETEPKIVEILELESDGNGRTESAICEKMRPIRAIIVSKAIRSMLKKGDIERTGRGKKGDPFQYTMAVRLDLSDHSDGRPNGGEGRGAAYSVPIYPLQGNGIQGGMSGTESKKSAEPVDNSRINSVPKKTGPEQELNGNRMELNPETDTSGTESKKIWDEVDR
jgi:Bifunctional DNA primase/polymerase, N-terminal/AAA domain/Primase C terminal 1 (PriCT-1)